MFFYLSKIFWIIAAPLSFLWFLVLIGFGLRFWKKGLGNKILLFSGVAFLIIGFFPVGYNMMVFLERQYERPDPMPRRVDGIIVLGGAFNSTLSEKTGKIAANGNINRMIDFVELARKYPRAKLIFAGGSGSIYNPDRKEADDAEKFLKMIGFNAKRVVFERESRNSYENVRNSHELVKPKEGQNWIAITSASHMPRAIGVFQHHNWQVIPYPSGPKTDGQYRFRPKPFGVVGSFFMLGLATKEFIGATIYYFSGKSALLLPVRPLNSPELKNRDSAKERAK